MKYFICIFCSILAFTKTIHTQSGLLDASFDADGLVITSNGLNNESANSCIIQADGKIVVGGFSASGPSADFIVARFNADGSLDNSFDADGLQVIDINGMDDRGTSIAIQFDNKILQAGYSENGSNMDFAVVRYNINGSLDTTFSSDGKILIPVGVNDDFATSIKIQSDNKIIVAGYSLFGFNNDFSAIRLNTDGILDTTFGNNGIMITPIGSSQDLCHFLTIQSDDKIVLSGSADNGSNFDVAIARFNTDGSPDNSFDADGKVITDLSNGNEEGYSTIIQQDGKIIIGGYRGNVSNPDFFIIRYNSNGTIDSSFGTNGFTTSAIGSATDKITSIAQQPDGKVLATGYSFNGIDLDFSLARYTMSGLLDTTFNSIGYLMTDFGAGGDLAYAVAVQSDFKIVVAGLAYNGANNDLGVARYLSDLHIGLLDFSTPNLHPLIYPNPLDCNSILKYSLSTNETISITICDTYGNIVSKIIDNEYQPSGEYSIKLNQMNSCKTGVYYITLSNGLKSITIKTVK